MPQVNLYFTASRLTLAGCRWKKTLERTESARLRGVSSCLTRKIERNSWVFSGSFKPSSSSLPFSLIVSLRSVTSWRTRSSNPVPFLLPFSSAIPMSPQLVPSPQGKSQKRLSNVLAVARVSHPWQAPRSTRSVQPVHPVYVASISPYSKPSSRSNRDELQNLYRQIRARVIKLIHASARVIHVQPAGVHNQFSCGIHRHVRAIHGPGRWALEIHALAVVAASMARALKFIFRRFPFRRASQVRAPRENNKNAVRLADDPHAIGHQIALVDAQRKISRVSDIKDCVGFVQRAREEKP